MTYKLIDYEDLNAFSEKLKTKYATKNEIPTNLSDLQEDTSHRLVTDAEKTKWNDKVSQSQIISNLNEIGSDKIFSANFVKNMLTSTHESKIDKFSVTDFYQEDMRPDLVLSQKGANNLWLNTNKIIQSKYMDCINGISGMESAVNSKADKDEIPTKVSQLTNDKNFKTESEIQSMIEKASSLKKEVVTSLPTTGKDDVIYLVKDPDGKDNNNYLEYLWLNGKYELIGSTQVDLSGYATKNDVQNVSENTEAIQNLQDGIENLIPKTDVLNSKTTGNSEQIYTAGVVNNISDEMNKSIETMSEQMSEHIEKKLDKTDIQEFTIQELEEAFK